MNIFTMYRGDDKLYELTVKDKETGVVVDITGCTIILYWYSKGTDIVEKQWSFVLTDPTNGLAEVSIAAADTSGLTYARHEFEFKVKITKADLKVETLVSGKFIVEA